MKPSSFQTALDHLRAGDAVAIPTETVYGLAADISQPSAIEKIFALKKRPFFDPLIVHVSSRDQLSSLVEEIPPIASQLMEKFWPGPITFVLPKKKTVNDKITSGLNTVGVRMPNHPVTLELIRQLGSPVAAPSANLFGQTSPTQASHVRDEFGDDVFVLDGGPCLIGVESTVVGFRAPVAGLCKDTTLPGEIVIYRPGGVTKEEIEHFVKDLNDSPRVVVEQSPVAPGHLKHHYMPKIPLVMIQNPVSENSLELSAVQRAQIDNKLKFGDGDWNPIEMTLPSDANLAARELYSELRRCGESGASLILLHRSADKDSGLWSAIWNRLEKAATLIL